MKSIIINNLEEFKKTQFYDIFVETSYKKNFSDISDVIENIQINGRKGDLSIKDDCICYIYSIVLEGGVIFTVGASQSLYEEDCKFALSSRTYIDDYITISFTKEFIISYNNEQNEILNSIMNLITEDKEDGYKERKEYDLSDEVISGLRNNGIKLKNENHIDGLTGKKKRITIIEL